MLQRSVPRAHVVAVATAIVALSAGFSAAGPYRTSDGLVIHRHTDTYSVNIPDFPDSPQLTSRIKDARAEWDADLDPHNALDINSTPDSGAAALKFENRLLPAEIESVRVDNEQGWGRHPTQRTIAVFNKKWTSGANAMSALTMRGYACRTIGEAVGLDTVPDRGDCMEAGPIAYSHVGATSIGHAVAFYKPQVGDISGTLVSTDTLTSKAGLAASGDNYSLNVNASGLGVKRVLAQIVVPGGANLTVFDQTLPANTGSDTYEAQNCRPICRWTATGSITKSALGAGLPGPGRYTLRVSAFNTFGRSSVDQSEQLWFEFPYFGYNDDWIAGVNGDAATGPPDTWEEDRSTDNPFALAEAGGSNTYRFSMLWDKAMPCREAADRTPADQENDPGVENFDFYNSVYERGLEGGMRPIIDLHGAGVCRDADDVSGTGAAADSCKKTRSFIADPNVKTTQMPADSPTVDQKWQAFAGRVAEQFPEALAIEVWNEPNAAAFWGGCEPQPERYAELLELAYAGVNASANPSMPVISAGLVPGRGDSTGTSDIPGGPATQFTKKLAFTKFLDAEINPIAPIIRANSDGIGLHPYRSQGQAEAGDTPQAGSAEHLRDVDDIFDAIEPPGAAEPFYITEVGVMALGEEEDREDPDFIRSVKWSDAQADALLATYQAIRASYRSESQENGRNREVASVVVHRLTPCNAGASCTARYELGLPVRVNVSPPQASPGDLNTLEKWTDPTIQRPGQPNNKKNAYCELAKLRDYSPQRHASIPQACPGPSR